MRFRHSLLVLMLLGVFIIKTSVPLVTGQEGQVVLNPTDDTYVKTRNPDWNYGDQDQLEVSKYESFVFEVHESIVWLKFDLNSVPEGAMVDSAILEMHVDWVNETYEVYAHYGSDNSWTELSLTYYNMPMFNITPMDSVLITKDDETCSWNVVDAVGKAVDGIHGSSDVVSIVLRETSLRGAYSSIWFSSKEDEYYPAPKLTIYWSDVIPEFPTSKSLILVSTSLTVALLILRRRQVGKKSVLM